MSIDTAETLKSLVLPEPWNRKTGFTRTKLSGNISSEKNVRLTLTWLVSAINKPRVRSGSKRFLFAFQFTTRVFSWRLECTIRETSLVQRRSQRENILWTDTWNDISVVESPLIINYDPFQLTVVSGYFHPADRWDIRVTYKVGEGEIWTLMDYILFLLTLTLP